MKNRSNQRTHYVTTTDGVTIGGAVHGQGHPLVFLQEVIGDGDLGWRALLPHEGCSHRAGRGGGVWSANRNEAE